MKAVKNLMGASVFILLAVSVTIESLVETRWGVIAAIAATAAAFLLQRAAIWLDGELARKRRAAVESAAWKDLW